LAPDAVVISGEVSVGHDGAAGTVIEAQKAIKGLTDAGDVRVDLRRRQQLAGFVTSGWIAHFGGAATHQDNRAVSGLLEAAQQHDLHQAADMQAVSRGIESYIGRYHFGARTGVQRGAVGDLMDIAPFAQNRQEIAFERTHYLRNPLS
jgi:hypothetical protein